MAEVYSKCLPRAKAVTNAVLELRRVKWQVQLCAAQIRELLSDLRSAGFHEIAGEKEVIVSLVILNIVALF
jgi:hypothetical protein